MVSKMGKEFFLLSFCTFTSWFYLNFQSLFLSFFPSFHTSNVFWTRPCVSIPEIAKTFFQKHFFGSKLWCFNTFFSSSLQITNMYRWREVNNLISALFLFLFFRFLFHALKSVKNSMRCKQAWLWAQSNKHYYAQDKLANWSIHVFVLFFNPHKTSFLLSDKFLHLFDTVTAFFLHARNRPLRTRFQFLVCLWTDPCYTKTLPFGRHKLHFQHDSFVGLQSTKSMKNALDHGELFSIFWP